MFLSESSSIRISAVMEMTWSETERAVNARPFAALSLRIRGDSRITEGDKTEQLVTGDILYMPKGADYHIDCKEERILVIHFDTDETASPSMKHFRPESPQQFERMFRSLLEVWQQKHPGYYFEAVSRFYHLIYELDRIIAPESSSDYEKIRAATEYLHANFTDPDLDVQTLCRKAFMSDTYFRRLFRKYYETTPLKYLNALRIDQARILLRDLDCSVAEAANQSGFSDPKYFSTVFRKLTGVSPSEYRKNG